jgi:galactonate dehydratase
MLANGHRFFRAGPSFGRGDLYEPLPAARVLAAQLRAVREAVGEKMELMVDCHTRLDPQEAVWFCREVEDLDMYVVEDPIRAEYARGYHLIREHANVPLAAGEQWANKWEFREVIEEDLVDYVRIDVCNAAGLTEAKKIAGWAETHYIRLLLHNPLGPICTAACLHLDLACNNAGPQEIGFPPATMLPDVFECAFELQGTHLTIPSAPGIGVKFNRQAAEAYPAEMTEPPHLHRADGAYTNN